MSSSENGRAAPSGSPPAQSQRASRGFWALLGNTAGVAAVLGALGAAFIGLLQYISAYNDSVAKLAKNDLDLAVATLADTVSALSTPLSLQGRLIWFYSVAKNANTDADNDAYETKSARAIAKNYEDLVIALSAGIKLLARKMEIYLDLPGDLNHAADNSSTAKAEPIGTSNLRASDFVCDDKHMPFARDGTGKITSRLELMPKGDSDLSGKKLLAINWKSAKDNLLTLEYCFEITHEKMGEIRRWASQGSNDGPQPAKATKAKELDIGGVKTLAKLQEQRFSDFMSVATFKIEQFRVKYQPNGLLCTVLGVDTTLDYFAHVCTPRPIAE